MSCYEKQTAQQLHEVGVFSVSRVEDFVHRLVVTVGECILLSPRFTPYNMGQDDRHQLLYRYRAGGEIVRP